MEDIELDNLGLDDRLKEFEIDPFCLMIKVVCCLLVKVDPWDLDLSILSLVQYHLLLLTHDLYIPMHSSLAQYYSLFFVSSLWFDQVDLKRLNLRRVLHDKGWLVMRELVDFTMRLLTILWLRKSFLRLYNVFGVRPFTWF